MKQVNYEMNTKGYYDGLNCTLTMNQKELSKIHSKAQNELNKKKQESNRFQLLLNSYNKINSSNNNNSTQNNDNKQESNQFRSIDWENYKMSDIYQFEDSNTTEKIVTNFNHNINHEQNGTMEEQKDGSTELNSSKITANISNQSKNISPLSSFLQNQNKSFFASSNSSAMANVTTGDDVVDQILSQVSKKMTI